MHEYPQYIVIKTLSCVVGLTGLMITYTLSPSSLTASRYGIGHVPFNNRIWFVTATRINRLLLTMYQHNRYW